MRKNPIVVIAASMVLFFISCGKPSPKDLLPLQQFFETNILNRNYVVSLAQDSTGDITSQYSGYVFILRKTDFYHGPLEVSKGSNHYTGSWACDNDYGKLTITLPTAPEEFQFLTRDWRFVKKDIPTLQLAPWGAETLLKLNMTQQ